MNALAYELHHVDAGCHEPFPLTRVLPVVPAPILGISNTRRAISRPREGSVYVVGLPHAPRHIMRSDWT